MRIPPVIIWSVIIGFFGVLTLIAFGVAFGGLL